MAVINRFPSALRKYSSSVFWHALSILPINNFDSSTNPPGSREYRSIANGKNRAVSRSIRTPTNNPVRSLSREFSAADLTLFSAGEPNCLHNSRALCRESEFEFKRSSRSEIVGSRLEQPSEPMIMKQAKENNRQLDEVCGSSFVLVSDTQFSLTNGDSPTSMMPGAAQASLGSLTQRIAASIPAYSQET